MYFSNIFAHIIEEMLDRNNFDAFDWFCLFFWPITFPVHIIGNATKAFKYYLSKKRETGIYDKHGNIISVGDRISIQEDYGFTGYDGWPKGPITSGTIKRNGSKFVLNTGEYTLSDWDQFDDIWIEQKLK